MISDIRNTTDQHGGLRLRYKQSPSFLLPLSWTLTAGGLVFAPSPHSDDLNMSDNVELWYLFDIDKKSKHVSSERSIRTRNRVQQDFQDLLKS